MDTRFHTDKQHEMQQRDLLDFLETIQEQLKEQGIVNKMLDRKIQTIHVFLKQPL